jgi:tRNA dimethylallyltransferase
MPTIAATASVIAPEPGAAMRTNRDDMKHQQNQKSVLLIAGPTASGKSALALKMAQELNGVIINADSMQVYSELRILTARPNEVDEAEAPHKLYGHVAGTEDYSVAHWLAQAQSEIEQAWYHGKLPIICGGTGLYFMALEKGLAKVPPIAPTIREKWRSFKGDVMVELKLRDPVYAQKLNPADKQRIVRALEVFESSGKSLLVWQAEAQHSAFLNQVQVTRKFISVPREELYTRANQRFEKMLEQGALNEVKDLPKLDAAAPLMKAIGVPELQRHLKGEISREEAITLGQTATRHYIKRQMTWFRGQMKHWMRNIN